MVDTLLLLETCTVFSALLGVLEADVVVPPCFPHRKSASGEAGEYASEMAVDRLYANI